MAFYENIEPLSMPIGGAIAQYIFVTINTSGQVIASGDGLDAVGVTLEAVSAAQYDSGDGQTTVSIAMTQGGGKVPVRAAATTAVAIGDAVASAASGELKPAATGDAILGVALAVAGVDADQEIITILLNKASRFSA